MKVQKLLFGLGVVAAMFVLAANLQYAIRDYGIRTNSLHHEILAQTSAGTTGSSGAGDKESVSSTYMCAGYAWDKIEYFDSKYLLIGVTFWVNDQKIDEFILPNETVAHITLSSGAVGPRPGTQVYCPSGNGTCKPVSACPYGLL